MLALGRESASRGGADLVVAGVAFVLLGEELHRQPHAGQLGAGNVERAGFLRPARQHDGVEIVLERLEADFDANLARSAELDAFRLHLHRAAVDVVLLQLEVGDAVTEQSADPVALLEHRDGMPRARELLRAGEPGGAAAYDRHRLAAGAGGRLGYDPALAPAAVDDGAFDRLDRDRSVDQVERAGGLARCRADAAGELGKVVG